MRTPTIANPSAAWSARSVLNNGNSSRHGTQLGPQKFTMTGRPRSEASENEAPSRVRPVKAGTGWPFAIGGGSVASAWSMAARNWTSANVAIAATTRPRRMSRRRRSSSIAVTAAYWTLSVPVIWSIGWIEQMNT